MVLPAAGDDLTAAVLAALVNNAVSIRTAAASGNQTMGAVADITGATVTFTTTTPNCQFFAYGAFDVIVTNDSTNTFVGSCSADGIAFTDTVNIKDQSSGVGLTFRSTTGKLWSGTLATPGSHTIKLRGATTGGTTTVTQGSHTNIIVVCLAP